MRLILLSVLLASTALVAPALAQETTPPPVKLEVAPAQEAPPPPPVIAMAPPVEEAPPAIPEIWAPVPRDRDGNSAYGLWLAGRLALATGEAETGADYLQRAYALTPEQPVVRDQAFTAALFGGDLAFAARTTPTGEDVSPVLSQAGRLIEVVDTWVRGDARAAAASLVAAPIGQPHGRAGLYVRPFIALAAGDTDLALRLPNGPAGDPTILFARFNRTLVLETLGRFDEAEAEYRTLMGVRAGAQLFRQPYGEFLERRGRLADALAVYDAGITPNGASPQLEASRAAAAAGRRAPLAPTLKEAAATGLSTAAIQAGIDGAHEFAAVYLRLALLLDPADELKLRLGQTLAEAELEEAARAALAGVGTSDPTLYAAARTDMALSFERQDKSDEALAELRRAYAAAPENTGVVYLLSAQLTQMEQYDEALTLLNGPVLNAAGQGFEIHFLRGAAYESRGDIALAEAELWAAHQMNPDDATVLNYLGYLWVDRGLRVEQGADMIARAFAADPDNGNIQDSLGWAQYRQGQYDEAVVSLEAAVEKEPANAEINDHLGDAYWQVGRTREARFQWSRVLTLEPDAERRTEAERKLSEGLATAVPVSDGAQP